MEDWSKKERESLYVYVCERQTVLIHTATG